MGKLKKKAFFRIDRTMLTKLIVCLLLTWSLPCGKVDFVEASPLSRLSQVSRWGGGGWSGAQCER